MADPIEFKRLANWVRFGGSSFFDPELHEAFDIRVELNLPLVQREEGVYRFITSQPFNNQLDRFYTTWEADVRDLDNTTVEMVGRYRFMNEQDAIDLAQHP